MAGGNARRLVASLWLLGALAGCNAILDINDPKDREPGDRELTGNEGGLDGSIVTTVGETRDAQSDVNRVGDADATADVDASCEASRTCDLGCNLGYKRCGAVCVALTDPAYGCGDTTCDSTVCPDAGVGTLVCSGGVCIVGACIGGTKQCGNFCVPTDVSHGCQEAARCAACGATDTCSGAPSTCCTPESIATTCAKLECGLAQNNCGVAVDCGCNAPSGPTCPDPRTVRTFASTGTCNGATCTYAPTDEPCGGGTRCHAGVCKTVVPTLPPPLSISFVDQEPSKDKVAGTITVSKAGDESSITGYELYWGDGPTTKLGFIAALSKTGLDVSTFLSTTVPGGATHLLAFSTNAGGEISQDIAVGPVDNYPIATNVGVNNIDSLWGYSPIIDSEDQKLLIVTTDRNAGGKPALVRCALDGTACVYVDISAGQPANSRPVSLGIDSVGKKLLVVGTASVQNMGNHPYLYRCALDGSACTASDLVAGTAYAQVMVSPPDFPPRVLFDTDANRLLVVFADVAGTKLLRCDFDGTGCAYSRLEDIPLGARTMSALIDDANKKLLVVTGDGTGSANKPLLTRCALDGTSCSTIDISAGRGRDSAVNVSATIDPAAAKLLVATENRSGSPYVTSLFRCNLDGTGCAATDLSPSAFGATSIMLDESHGRILVVVANNGNGQTAALYRCLPDGSGCSYTDLDPVGHLASGLLDPLSKRLLAVVGLSAGDPRLISLRLW